MRLWFLVWFFTSKPAVEKSGVNKTSSLPGKKIRYMDGGLLLKDWDFVF